MQDKVKGLKFNMEKKNSLTGWFFLLPASLLIVWMNFYPMFQALLLSFKSGVGAKLKWAGLYNYTRLFGDKIFIGALKNTFTYLIIQVPIMLIMALIFATMLNNKKLKFKAFFRTCIFLPCATALVSYSMIFRTMFAPDGFVNFVLVKVGILQTGINWLGDPATAKMVIIIALLWRWTGYNMVFYLAALQNIDASVYEAAILDGAGPIRTFTDITVPLLKPMILLTAIVSTNGTLQLFDESMVITGGGPANTTITMSHYLYKLSFVNNPNFGYAAALSYIILGLVAVLAVVQMMVGDKRD